MSTTHFFKNNTVNRLSIFVVMIAMLIMVMAPAAYAAPPASKFGDPSATFMGFGANQGGGGALSLGWTSGNLGNTWAEGEWIPYQLVLTGVQTAWDPENTGGLPGMAQYGNKIEIAYDFTSKGNRFIDMVRSIQVGSAELPNTKAWPLPDGSAYPMTTRNQIEDAQNDDYGNLALENEWPGFKLLSRLKYPDSPFDYTTQVHRPLSGSTPSYTDAERKIVITLADLTFANVLESDTIVIYFQLHESRTFVWQNQLANQLNNADGFNPATEVPTFSWGGYTYVTQDAVRNGSGYVSGSSGHARITSFGNKDVPVPVPPAPTGSIAGLKWRDLNMNGLFDPSEQYPETGIGDWKIRIELSLGGISFAMEKNTNADGSYSFGNLTAGTWFVSEGMQAGYVETFPKADSTVAPWAAAVPDKTPAQPLYKWQVILTASAINATGINFGNMNAAPAFTISKTGDALSKVGDEVDYVFELVNTGNVPLTKVSVSDNRIADLDTVANFPSVLAVGQTFTFTYENFVIPSTTDDPFVNTITVVYEYAPMGPSGVVSHSDSHSTNLFQPDLSISKDTDKDYYLVGETIQYTITVDNQSSSDSPDLAIDLDDPMFAGDTLNDPFNMAANAANKVFSPTHVVLASDGDATKALADDKITNTVTLSASPVGFPNVLNRSATATVRILRPGLSIVKTGPALATPGGKVTYQFTITNTGNVPLVLKSVSDDKIGSLTADVPAAGATLDPGEMVQFSKEFMIPADTSPDAPYTNIVNAVYEINGYDHTGHEVTAQDSHTLDLFVPSIEISKTGVAAVPNGKVTYEVKIKNTSSMKYVPAEPVTLPDLVVTAVDAKLGIPLVGDTSSFNLATGITRTWTFTDFMIGVPGSPFTNTATVIAHPDGFADVAFFLFF